MQLALLNCPFPGCVSSGPPSVVERHFLSHHAQFTVCPKCPFTSHRASDLREHLFGNLGHYPVRRVTHKRGPRLFPPLSNKVPRDDAPRTGQYIDLPSDDVDGMIPNNQDTSCVEDNVGRVSPDLRTTFQVDGDDDECCSFSDHPSSEDVEDDSCSGDDEMEHTVDAQGSTAPATFDAARLLVMLEDRSSTKASLTLRMATWAVNAGLTRASVQMGTDLGLVHANVVDNCASKLDNILNSATAALYRELSGQVRQSDYFSSDRIRLDVCLRFWCAVPAVASEILNRNSSALSIMTAILDGTMGLPEIRALKFERYEESWHSVRWYEAVYQSRHRLRLVMNSSSCQFSDIVLVHVHLYHDFFRPFKHRLGELGMFAACAAAVPVHCRASANSPALFPLSIFQVEKDGLGICASVQRRLASIRGDFEEIMSAPLSVRFPDGRTRIVIPIYFGFVTDGKARNDVAGFGSIGFSKHPCTWCDIHVDEIAGDIYGDSIRAPVRRSDSDATSQLAAQASAAGQSLLAQAHIRSEHGIRAASELFRFPCVDPLFALETLLLDSLHAEGCNDCQAVISHMWYRSMHEIPDLFQKWSDGISRHPWANPASKPPAFHSFNEWINNLTAAQKIATMRCGIQTLTPVFAPVVEKNPALASTWRLVRQYLEYSRLAFGHSLAKDALTLLGKLVVASRRALLLLCGTKEATINVHYQTHLVPMLMYQGHNACHSSAPFENIFLVLRRLLNGNNNGRNLAMTALRRLFLWRVVTITSCPRRFSDWECDASAARNMNWEQLEDHIDHRVPGQLRSLQFEFVINEAARVRALAWRGVRVCASCDPTGGCIAVVVGENLLRVVSWFAEAVQNTIWIVARLWHKEPLLYDATLSSLVFRLSLELCFVSASSVQCICEMVPSAEHPGLFARYRIV